MGPVVGRIFAVVKLYRPLVDPKHVVPVIRTIDRNVCPVRCVRLIDNPDSVSLESDIDG